MTVRADNGGRNGPLSLFLLVYPESLHTTNSPGRKPPLFFPFPLTGLQNIAFRPRDSLPRARLIYLPFILAVAWPSPHLSRLQIPLINTYYHSDYRHHDHHHRKKYFEINASYWLDSIETPCIVLWDGLRRLKSNRLCRHPVRTPAPDRLVVEGVTVDRRAKMDPRRISGRQCWIVPRMESDCRRRIC